MLPIVWLSIGGVAVVSVSVGICVRFADSAC